MATSSTHNNNNNKPVTGYPAQPMTGYPSTTTATTATAYAYPYPPPPPPPTQNAYYQTYQPPQGPTYYYRPSNGPTLLRRLIIAGIILFTIMGLIFFVTWLVLKPHLPEFRVDSASVSQLNATQSELTATWGVTLLVKNPNHKLSISYDRLQASISYKDESQGLGDTELAPFQQGKRNETRVRFEVSSLRRYVSEGTVKRINEERGSDGSVDFRVKVRGLVRFRAGVWRMREHLMRVYCDPLNFSSSSNLNNATATSLPQSKPCQVFL